MKIPVILVVAGISFHSAYAWGDELAAPANSTKESRTKETGRCLAVAQGRYSRNEGYSLLGIYDDLKKYVLKGRDTGGYIYTTTLSRRSSPVVNDEAFPVRRKTLIGTQSADDVSDRYVMCLLDSGFKWQGSERTFIDEVRGLAEKGVAPAQAGLAMLYTSHGTAAGRLDLTEFARLTRKAAEQGYAIAQFNLSYAYANGDGVEKNDEEALHWMLMAAKNGYSRAMPILEKQEQIRSALRARRQDVAGLESDQRAAQSGEAKAQFILATRFEDGRGVERSMIRAIEWYQKSAENGFADAQAYLGVIYDKGRGVKQDDVQAFHWYRKAAEQGQGQSKSQSQSQFNLGLMYFYGRGIETNKAEAKKWFERARNNGFPDAAIALTDLF